MSKDDTPRSAHHLSNSDLLKVGASLRNFGSRFRIFKQLTVEENQTKRIYLQRL